MPRYGQVVAFPRCTDPATFCRLPHVREVEGVDAAFVGIPFDSDAISVVGARYGPRAVRETSHDFMRAYYPRLGVMPFEALSVVDYGDAAVVPGDTEATLQTIEADLSPLASAGVGVIAVGGAHGVTLPHLRALQAHAPLSLLLLDSHTDATDHWLTRYNHGTWVPRAVEEGLVDPGTSIMVGMNGSIHPDMAPEVAEALGFRVVALDELDRIGVDATVQLVRERLGDREVFVSFDVDVMDNAFAPGSGAPEIGGLTPRELLRFLTGLRGVNLRSCDVVEVNPYWDTPGRTTALLAANVAYNFLALMALRGRPLRPA
jgi:agmatinase